MYDLESPKSFTAEFNALSSMLITACGVSRAYKPASGTRHPAVVQFNALWDTGAEKCSISRRAAEALGLTPCCSQLVRTASSSEGVLMNLYLLNFLLPNGVELPMWHAAEAKLVNYDIIIGMDVIRLGDFSITHKDGKTKLTFQMPPSHDHDFVKENAALYGPRG